MLLWTLLQCFSHHQLLLIICICAPVFRSKKILFMSNSEMLITVPECLYDFHSSEVIVVLGRTKSFMMGINWTAVLFSTTLLCPPTNSAKNQLSPEKATNVIFPQRKQALINFNRQSRPIYQNGVIYTVINCLYLLCVVVMGITFRKKVCSCFTGLQKFAGT